MQSEPKKSAASATSLDYVKFQAVMQSAASEASLRGGCASIQLDHVYVFFATCSRTSDQRIVKISDSALAANLETCLTCMWSTESRRLYFSFECHPT